MPKHPLGADQYAVQAGAKTLEAGLASVAVMGDDTLGPPKQLVPSLKSQIRSSEMGTLNMSNKIDQYDN